MNGCNVRTNNFQLRARPLADYNVIRNEVNASVLDDKEHELLLDALVKTPSIAKKSNELCELYLKRKDKAS